MRITGGKRRGLYLKEVTIAGVRPTKSMVREAVFNVLGLERLTEAVVADLFAGTGIMTLEALSRGAAEVWCVDREARCCTMIRQHLERAGFSDLAHVVHAPASTFITAQGAVNRRFDLIFMDPPYQSGLQDRCLYLIAKEKILSPHGVLVVEHDYRYSVSPCPPLMVWKVKRYGHSSVTFMICQEE
ncbi:MAG: 16S rRNA (guanine(966)-N(2))-methyltransferase RsmD [Deltaproteobacteria bacterium]|nr:16S rRNA (guanine(966)-N(2))-methyltransferase RsmD [Candidatus Anaeroferrophillus wilburensis]MBN2888295.1 16S rRNA (guanine(966)-N(2))-methyltransferase RsmD [Deltaproteobacteria bacterium]